MIIEVDPGDPTPVYEQIRSQVTGMVVAGTLAAGTRLPTIRQLATDLGLAKGTVAKAYEVLLRDHVVESAGRKGTVVAGGHVPDADARARDLGAAARSYAVRTRQLGADADEAVAAFRFALDELARPDQAPAGGLGTAGGGAVPARAGRASKVTGSTRRRGT